MSRPEFLPLATGTPRPALPLRPAGSAAGTPLRESTAPEGVALTAGPGGRSESERIRDAARQFEALFLSYLYKTMRETVPDSPFSEGQSSAGYEEMFTPAMGENLSKAGGMGLAELLVQHFEAGGARAATEALRSVRTDESRHGGIGALSGAPGTPNRSPAGHSAPSGGDAPRPPVPAFRAAPADRTAVEKSHIEGKKVPALADNVRQALDRAAEQTGVDRALLQAVVVVESGGNPRAESRRGARGLMQLMAGTARELGVKDAFDPLENVLAGARYLKRMLVAHGGDERLALAAYNAGPGNVRRHNGVPPFRETHNYIERVLDIRKRLGGPLA